MVYSKATLVKPNLPIGASWQTGMFANGSAGKTIYMDSPSL